jgi:hypothetical protein
MTVGVIASVSVTASATDSMAVLEVAMIALSAETAKVIARSRISAVRTPGKRAASWIMVKVGPAVSADVGIVRGRQGTPRYVILMICVTLDQPAY